MNKFLIILAFLACIGQVRAQKVVINELSASVTNSQVDNYGEFEDWIEIYNGSGSDINLAGWFLSDNPAKPLKWKIPDTNPKLTAIPEGCYLLLWADKDSAQGPDHLGFSLKKEGECLLLYRPGKEGPVLEDSIRYGALPPDHSFGRCAGQDKWMEFKHPSPGKPNVCLDDPKRKPLKIPLPEPPGPGFSWGGQAIVSSNGGLIMALNEISCNNKQSLPDAAGEYDDWIELYNPGATAVNIAGWYISDTLDYTIFHRIPSYDPGKTTVPPGGYLILWADGQPAQGVTHLPFKLDKDGEEFYLARFINSQYQIIDEVSFPEARNDVTFGRIPDGSGAWKRLSDPTPGAANLPPRTTGEFLLNELMAASGPGLTDEFGEQEDWIEFYNPTGNPVDLGGLYLTDSLGDPMKSHVTVFSPDSTTIPPRGYLVFFADNETWQGARHLGFKLAAKGSRIAIYQADGVGKISELHYSYQAGDASYGRFPNGSANWIFTNLTPGRPNQFVEVSASGLFINEFMAENHSSYPDNSGRMEDWIEIYNSNAAPVNAGGLYLTDSLSDPLKFRIPNTYPDSTVVAPHGFLVLWADNSPERGVRHLDFKLSAAGESIGLSRTRNDGLGEFIDSITYTAQLPDISYGRISDGDPSWTRFLVPTPESSNGAQSTEAEMKAFGAMEVFPNPCTNHLNLRIQLDEPGKVLVEVFNGVGVRAARFEFGSRPAGWNNLRMDNLDSWLGPGNHVLRISTGTRTGYAKFTVIK
jgi:hypothetical protein